MRYDQPVSGVLHVSDSASKAALNQMLRVTLLLPKDMNSTLIICSTWLRNCKGNRSIQGSWQCIQERCQRQCFYRLINSSDDGLHSDMANVAVDWEVEGIISARESVAGMLQVIGDGKTQKSGTFWTWEGKVSPNAHVRSMQSSGNPGIPLVGGSWVYILRSLPFRANVVNVGSNESC